MNEEKTNNEKSDEDFSILVKIVIVLFWFSEWKYRTGLKELGYTTKSRSRTICVIIGIILYSLIIILANINTIHK